MSLNKGQFLLLKLMEECAEVSQEASKCIQFGLYETYVEVGISNKERLERELNDLQAIIEIIKEQLCVDSNFSKLEDVEDKKEKLNKYLKYSHQLGCVDKIQV